jgi:hypothetical protein
MIIVSSRLCVFFSWFTGFSKTAKAVTVFPFIFVRSKNELSSWLINHERIHIRQQMELLVVGAAVLYIIEFLYALIILRLPWYKAYLWTSAEQESYRKQNNSEYLNQRKIFSQFYYLSHKIKFTHNDGVVTVT